MRGRMRSESLVAMHCSLLCICCATIHRRLGVVTKLIGVSGVDFFGVLAAVPARPGSSCSRARFDRSRVGVYRRLQLGGTLLAVGHGSYQMNLSERGAHKTGAMLSIHTFTTRTYSVLL